MPPRGANPASLELVLVEEQRRDCPPLRALIEAMKQADANPAGALLWGPTGASGGPPLVLSRSAHDAAAGNLWLSRRTEFTARGILRDNWHQVFIRRGAAAADAFLREVGEALLELNHGLQRMDDRRLPNELRRKFAMMVRKTGGTAIASAATALAMVPTNPSRGAVPLAMAHVVFKFGDAVHKISVTETYGAVEMVDLMHYAFSYVIALSTALAQGERADTAAGGAGGGGDDQQGQGAEGAAGIAGSMSGVLLAKVLALPPGGELRLEL